jgi:hypothetical protein
MTKLRVGDTVSCRIKSSMIVNSYTDYDEIKSFVIVAVDDDGYFLYVPHYYCLKDVIVADAHRCKQLKIHHRYLNEELTYVQLSHIASVEKVQDGMNCCKCNEFYFYAAPNQENGTLICYGCRQNPYP